MKLESPFILTKEILFLPGHWATSQEFSREPNFAPPPAVPVKALKPVPLYAIWHNNNYKYYSGPMRMQSAGAEPEVRAITSRQDGNARVEKNALRNIICLKVALNRGKREAIANYKRKLVSYILFIYLL